MRTYFVLLFISNDSSTHFRSKLSERQKQVLQLAANGHSNKQIATRLNVSIDTVDTHNRNITRCLKAKNMKEAVAIGIRSGIIE